MKWRFTFGLIFAFIMIRELLIGMMCDPQHGAPPDCMDTWHPHVTIFLLAAVFLVAVIPWHKFKSSDDSSGGYDV